MKHLRLLYSFYLGYALPAILLSICCAVAINLAGVKFLPLVCWFKLITLLIFFYFVNSYKRKEIYYYYNLGLSKKQLWGSSVAFDITVFILLLISALQLPPLKQVIS
jgi:hypothetical protein